MSGRIPPAMNRPCRAHPVPGARAAFSVGCLLVVLLLIAPVSSRLQAQSVSGAPNAAQLTKYDADKNGRLDSEEEAALRTDEAKARGAVTALPADAPPTGDKAIRLSPFEVREANSGYYATSTMSGTRLNSKLEDLASSISVVTKAQMQDFAMLDINDIFAYESSTEGTANYTAFEVDRNGMVNDQIQNNPQGANRIRGMGGANISLNGFATSGRVPIDPSEIDAVEISRGPNSSIFGLGEGSGTVNLVASSANVARASSTAQMRFDNLGGRRVSLDLNRPLLRGKLAFRVIGVNQLDAYPQKPSGFATRRLNTMLRFQPFQGTTVRASMSSYSGVGTRPNAVTPRDAISYWKSLGSPVWDPITSSVTVDGVTTVMGTRNPNGLGNQSLAQPILYVDNGIQLWQIGRKPSATATNGPNNTAGNDRLLESVAEPVRTGRPLFSTLPGVSSKSVYDYSRINLGGANSLKDQVVTSTVEVEQFLLNTERNRVAVQFAWQREDADRINRNIIGQATSPSASYYLYIDPNTRLLDGRTNPFFGRPYIGAGEPYTREIPSLRDSYRGQGAYILDFSNAKGWTRWLGRQQVLGYYEERKTTFFTRRFRDVNVLDNPLYAPAGQPKANQIGIAGPPATRGYYHYYVGDNQGQNADYGTSGYNLGNYTYNWFNPSTNAWVADPAVLGRSAVVEGTTSRLNLIKTRGAMLQSNLLRDRLIFTFGLREDESRDKNGRAALLMPDGWHFDEAAMDGWVGDWALRSGKTKTSGVVAKPFRGWGFVERQRAAGGPRRWVGELLSGLTGYYNKSDSFRPEAPAISITLMDLPNPSSIGKDYGFSINLGNKFVLRANRYETNQINSRATQNSSFSIRAGRIDFAPFAGENDAMSLLRQARNWVNPTGALTPAQVATAVAAIMKLPESYLETLNANTLSETSDVTARGNEYELSFNPSSFWTLRANLTRSESMDANLSPNIGAWLAQRLPVWESIIDPRTGTKWLDTIYSGDLPNGTAARGTTTATPGGFLVLNVLNPLRIAQATEGKSKPQVREWRFNLSTSYRLEGLFGNAHLKRMSVGGGVRWESKGAIGYYGVPVNGDVAAATELDPNRPIWDKAHAYFDGFATYSTRLFRDKIRARFQLNVRNIQESKAHLRPVGAYPNGQPHTFRVIDPRTFIFTTTFDL